MKEVNGRSLVIAKSVSLAGVMEHVEAHLVPLDDVFELTGLFLLDVRQQEHDGSSQTVVLDQERRKRFL